MWIAGKALFILLVMCLKNRNVSQFMKLICTSYREMASLTIDFYLKLKAKLLVVQVHTVKTAWKSDHRWSAIFLALKPALYMM